MTIGVGLGLGDGVGVGASEGDALGDGEMLADGEPLGGGEMLGEGEPLVDDDGFGCGDFVGEAEGVGEGVRFALACALSGGNAPPCPPLHAANIEANKKRTAPSFKPRTRIWYSRERRLELRRFPDLGSGS